MELAGHFRLPFITALATVTFAVGAPGVAHAHPTVKTVAGNGTAGYTGDGHAARAAELHLPSDAVPLSHGGFLIADKKNHAIRRVSRRGRITTIAGTGMPGFNGDGIPAVTSQLAYPPGVAPLPHGAFLIADCENERVRKVDRNGVIHTVAGTGVAGFSGDGHKATHAELTCPARVAPLSSGGFLIADFGNNRIRKVSASGIIHTVAGNGTAGSTGDGGPAKHAELNAPANAAPLPKGGFLISEYSGNVIRRVSPSGVIHTVAGTGVPGFSGDGHAAKHAELSAPTYAVPAPGGGILISDYANNRIRKVSKSGVIRTIVGTGVGGFNGDGHRPTHTELDNPTSAVPLPGGGLLISDFVNNRIRKVTSR